MTERAHMTVAVLRKKGGDVIFCQEFDIMDDPFQQMLGNGLGRISTTYQRQVKFGEEKVVVTVSCACNQDDATMNAAIQHSFMKAMQGTDWAYGVLMQMAQAEKPPTG